MPAVRVGIELGGVISGEHGIGAQEAVLRALGPDEDRAHAIKRVFDRRHPQSRKDLRHGGLVEQGQGFICWSPWRRHCHESRHVGDARRRPGRSPTCGRARSSKALLPGSRRVCGSRSTCCRSPAPRPSLATVWRTCTRPQGKVPIVSIVGDHAGYQAVRRPTRVDIETVARNASMDPQVKSTSRLWTVRQQSPPRWPPDSHARLPADTSWNDGVTAAPYRPQPAHRRSGHGELVINVRSGSPWPLPRRCCLR